MITDKKPDLTHFDAAGHARIVDISNKTETDREAVAEGAVYVNRDILCRIREVTLAKGDVLGVARVAGILAAKRVHELIPLAHPIMISKVTIDFELIEELSLVCILATVASTGKTGVEMEALTAVSIAGLTIYDMCKSIDKGIVISEIKLLSKKGGKSGEYAANK